MRQCLINLRTNRLQVLIALAMMAIGGSLWYDRHYFFWPPSLQNTLNDWRIDIVILLIGLALFLITAFNPDNSRMVKTLLIISGGITLGLAGLQIGHTIFTPEFRMGHTAIGDIVLFLLIVHVAHDR